MAKKKLSAQQAAYNKSRQAYMRAAGYDVPQDGSWGPWQESVWNKLTTRQKQYDTTLSGLAEGVWDKVTGNDTYRINPIAPATVKKYNPDEVDWGKTRRSQSKVINAISGTYLPAASVASLPAVARTAFSAPLATAGTLLGGYVGGKAVNKTSEALTGRDFGTNVAMNTPLTPGMGDMLNPGYAIGGGYGNFVGNNLANRGRYTLNYLTPASYENHAKELVTVATKPFYEAPPTFFNGRKPTWFTKYAQTEGVDAAEQRFQNGLVWADIPETEAAHPMYIKNTDGSYRLTPEGIGYKDFSTDALPEETTVYPDFFTRSGVGGEHSDYIKLGDLTGRSIGPQKATMMQFQDEQKLNPQWKIADRLKNKYHISKGSKAQKAIDYFGGKPVDWWAGYKPFTIKQNYLHNGNNVIPYLGDPSTMYVPNFIIRNNSIH